MARRTHWLIACIVTIALLAPALQASAQFTMNDYFATTWERTDKPVADGNVSRTWMWGPGPYTEPLIEPYAEGIFGEREVQYFDKSRMEITDPNADPDSIWYVTNGLLVVEMTSGEMQVGHDHWVPRWPAEVNVAGDADDFWGPTYETISWNIEDGHTYQDGQLITGVIDLLGYDPDTSDAMYGALAAYGVTAGPYSPDTGKHTASVFWEFMTSNALVYENGGLVNASLFENPYYATGLPIDQAWWAEVKVAGTYKWVLLQCFERRCLTYTPDNPPGWQVEAGNVGQHYYSWRYDGPVTPPMSEVDYIDALFEIDDGFLESVEYVDALWPDYALDDPTWVQAITSELAYWRELAMAMQSLNPPAKYAQLHQDFLEGYAYIVSGADYIEQGIATQDPDLIDLGWATFEIGWFVLDDAFADLLDNLPQVTETEYIDLVWAIDDEFIATVNIIDELWEVSDLDDPGWIVDFNWELDYLIDLAWLLEELTPPAAYAGIHAELLDAYAAIADAADVLADGTLNLDDDLIFFGWIFFDEALDELDAIMATFPTN